MEWKIINRLAGFSGAESVLRTEEFLLALWNHERCRGWQLYRFDRRGDTRWMVGAGLESLAWSEDQAKRWAESVMEQQS